MSQITASDVPYNQVRQRPDGGAIAWYRPDVEDDDAQPWLVIEQDPMYGVVHTWQPPEHVDNWPVLARPSSSRRSTNRKAEVHG